jgi:hypothetical protein
LDTSPRILAIDWSGAFKGSRKKIWLAEVSRDRLVCLQSGGDRSEITKYVIEESKKTPAMIVGLDFAFSCPEWFVRSKNCRTIHEFWSLVGEQGERWMNAWPFWSKCKPERQPDKEYRRCEEEVLRKPSSVFKLVGPAQVGRGSIRGMPCLLQLHQSGFSIWPFDPPGWPRAIEIYPRLFTPGIVKSDRDSRCKFLEKFRGRCSASDLKVAEDSGDAFDALVSAFALSEHLHGLCSLTQSPNAQTKIEAAIWS